MEEASRRYEKHYRESIVIPATVQDVFDYVDDQAKYYSHVLGFTRLLGGTMDLQADQGHGQAIDSHIRLTGKVLGASLSLEEKVTQREPPHSKSWETVGTPSFLIVGHYRYGVHVRPLGGGAVLDISFDFSPPTGSGPVRLLLSRIYGRICAREMATSTRNHFTKRRR